MTNPIRTRGKHYIRMAKLDAGYTEQRAWFAVGMQKHTVTLRCEPWVADYPLVVSYTAVNKDGTGQGWEQRFARADIDDARKLFTTAGRPSAWPFDTTTVQTLNEEGAR